MLRKKMVETGSSLLVIASALAIMLACKAGKNNSTEGSEQSSEDSTKSVTKEVELKVAASEILKDYKGNEVAADNKYKGKWVEVTGTVGDIKKDILDDIYVTVGTGARFEIPQVQCFLKEGLDKRAGELAKGQKITVTGRVDGLMMNVLVKECSF